MLVDVHAHLDRYPPGEVEEVVARARAAGVTTLVTVGTDLDSSREARHLAERFEGVHFSVGVHPHDSEKVSPGPEAYFAALREVAGSPRAVAVGETGLDYFRDYAPRDIQSTVFERQIALAQELGLPLIIHSRSAWDDTVALLEAAGDPPGIFHCFSGGPAEVAYLVELGYYASFAGNVTYPKAAALLEAAALVPGDRLLIETDCPFLSPQAVRGTTNEPANLVHTAAAIAGARGITLDALARMTSENARRVLSLGPL